MMTHDSDQKGVSPFLWQRLEKVERIHPHPVTGSIVILTVAHLDHNPENNDPANLKALCQRCHLAWDARQHVASARTTRHKKRLAAGQIELIPREEP